MLWTYPAAIIADCDLEIGRVFGERDLNLAVFRSETQRVIDQIANRALEQGWIGINLTFAAATDRNMMILGDRLLKRRDLFHRRATIESRPLDRFARRVNARDEEQIVNDSRQPFAFGNGGFDHFAILVRGAIT